MIIAVTTTKNDLDSEVFQRFGRTNFFLIVDTQTLKYKAVLNPNVNVMGGAGIQSAQLLIKEEVKAVLSGRLGMNAFRLLDTAGILVYENVEGKVRTAIENLNNNKLKPSNKIEIFYNNRKDFTTDRRGYRGGWQNDNENKNIETNNIREEIDRLKMKILTLENQLKEKQKQD
jgi:predicted Fe-Mo cluster-binding NifX family protein